MANGPAVLRSFIGGLGGKDVSDAEFDHIAATLEAARPSESPAEVELLMTQGEWQQVARSLSVAGKDPPITNELVAGSTGGSAAGSTGEVDGGGDHAGSA